MAYNLSKLAKEKIEAVTAELDYRLIKSRFDEPVDEAARQFTHKTSGAITHKIFHKIIAEFVEWIYDKGLTARWMISAEPLDQAIALLEEHYNSTYGHGYTAAILDAVDVKEGGIDTVLGQLAEIIKNIERQKYVNAVFAVNINPADWHLKCEIVNVLLDDYRQFLPQHLLECEPWELAGQIPSIMYRYICSESTLEELLCNQQISWKR